MPKNTSTVPVTYTGGVGPVDVLFPSGDRRRFTKDEPQDVLRVDAATLSRDEWAGEGVGTADEAVQEPTQEVDPQ